MRIKPIVVSDTERNGYRFTMLKTFTGRLIYRVDCIPVSKRNYARMLLVVGAPP